MTKRTIFPPSVLNHLRNKQQTRGSGSSFLKAPWKSTCHCYLLQNNSCCLQDTVSFYRQFDLSCPTWCLSFLPTKYTPSNVLWMLPTVSGLRVPLLVTWRPLDKVVKLHPALNLGSWKSCKKNELQWETNTMGKVGQAYWLQSCLVQHWNARCHRKQTVKREGWGTKKNTMNRQNNIEPLIIMQVINYIIISAVFTETGLYWKKFGCHAIMLT